MPDPAESYGAPPPSHARARIKRGLWSVLHRAGALGLQQRWRAIRGGATAAVIVFHRVTPDAPEDGITVHPQRFREICGMLRAAYDVISAGDLVERLAHEVPLTGREVVISFDDGYLDNREHAAPILKEHGLPAVFFLTAGYVGTAQAFPWDVAKGTSGPLMSWTQAREMAEMGFELGCHTWSHPDLGTTPVTDAGKELHDSRALIQDKTGTAVTHFAYPFGGRGNITPAWIDAAKAEGFASLFCGFGGLVTNRDVPHWIPRLGAAHQRTLVDLRIDIDEPW